MLRTNNAITMSVDTTIIVKHDFYEVGNFEKSKQFALNTIKKIQQRLCIVDDMKAFDTCFYHDDENPNWDEISFSLPFNIVQIRLNPGFWNIWLAGDYPHNILKNNGEGEFWFREEIFNIVYALGGNEAWYCDGDFGDGMSGVSFDEIIKIAEEHLSPIREFSPEDTEPAPMYHDNFDDYKEKLAKIKDNIGEYSIPTLETIGYGFYRVVRNGKVNLARQDTYEMVFAEDVDDIHANLNGCEFTVVKNGKTALFDGDATPLTDYVDGDFAWTWGHPDRSDSNIICKDIVNREANIRVRKIMYRDDREDECKYLPYSMQVDEKPMKCPVCSGKVLPIIYGSYTEDEAKMIRDNEAIMASGYIPDVKPNWECLGCETKFFKEN